jgi:dolichol kinase
MNTPSEPRTDDDLAFDELVERTEGLQPWRRVFHAGNGVVLALLPPALGLGTGVTVILLSIALVLQASLDVARLRVGPINRIFFRAFRTLASPREAAGVASSTWYTLGALVAWAVFPQPIASASILVLGLADPAAGVVGRVWGRRRIGKGTIEGTATFFLVASGVLLLFVGWPWALGAAAAAAVAEILPGLVDDNLVIPVITGAVLWLSNAPTSASSFPF